jgi:signal transduction histidine kinase
MNVISTRVFPLLVVLMLCSSVLFAQKSNDWRKEMDTIRGKERQVNWIFKTVYFDDRFKEQQLQMLDVALAMAKELNNDSLLGKVYLGIGGYYYYSTTQPKRGFPYLQRAKIHFLKSRSYNIIAQVIHPFCDWYFQCDRPDSVISILDRNQPIFKLMSNEKMKVRFQSMYGLAYAGLNKKEEARAEYRKALAASERLGDTPHVVNTCVNIALLYDRTDSAMVWYNRGLNYTRGSSPVLYAELLYRIGSQYAQSEGVSRDSALYYFFEAEKMLDVLTPMYKMQLYTAIGNYFSEKSERNIALGYYYKAYTYAEGLEGNFKGLVFNSLASTYINMKQLDSAEHYLILYKKEIDKNGREKQLVGYYDLNASYLAAVSGDSCSIDVLNNLLLALQYSVRIQYIDGGVGDVTQMSECLTRSGKREAAYTEIARDALICFDSLYMPFKKAERLETYVSFLEAYADLESLYGSREKATSLSREQASVLKKMLKEDYTKGMDEALVKYKSELKDAEIAYSKKTNMFLIGGLIFLFLVGVYIFINLRRTSILNTRITEQKKELEQINGVKDRLFSVISHDMRSPVNSLISFTQLLEDNAIPADKLAAYSASLKNSLGYTAGLMDNLLNWASSQMHGYKPVMENFDLNEVATGVVKLLTTEANKKQIAIHNNIISGTIVNADTNMTALLFRNLLSNAIKYTHKGGSIELGATVEKGMVRFVVKDFGVGIPATLVDKFNKASTLQPTESTYGTEREKGTGLGLMLCKNFVTLMGGNIKLESREGEGSIFEVSLKAV